MTTEALFDAAERGWKAAEAKRWSRPFFEWPGLWGEEEACFVLPLRLCKPTNQLMAPGMAGVGWKLAKHKKAVWVAMRMQASPRREPLPGRPMVVCVRFSIREPDKYADWAKTPIDKLLPTRQRRTQKGLSIVHGLNYLFDDSPSSADIHQLTWLVSKRADECVVIRIYSGKDSE